MNIHPKVKGAAIVNIMASAAFAIADAYGHAVPGDAIAAVMTVLAAITGYAVPSTKSVPVAVIADGFSQDPAVSA